MYFIYIIVTQTTENVQKLLYDEGKVRKEKRGRNNCSLFMLRRVPGQVGR